METGGMKWRARLRGRGSENIAILREILKKQYTVLAATSGQNAITLAAANPPPDLILLDIRMPNMDGFDVLKTLKTSQRTRQIKIVFVTSKRAIDDKMTAYEKGVEDCITKPIDPDFVLEIAERLTRKQPTLWRRAVGSGGDKRIENLPPVLDVNNRER
jgi:CheY-like chemotaxis protein